MDREKGVWQMDRMNMDFMPGPWKGSQGNHDPACDGPTAAPPRSWVGSFVCDVWSTATFLGPVNLLQMTGVGT